MTPQLRDAVICEPLRTPVGGYGGVFRDVTAAELAATVVRAVLARTGVPAEAVDDVILGQCYPNGEAPAIGRVAALDAGLPVEVPGVQVDRRCGSGLQAVINAAMQVQTGASDLVLAGGVESMSQAEFYTTGARWGVRGAGTMLHDRLARGRVTSGGTNYPVPGGMLETAENLRREYAIGREEQDRLALRSHEKAVAAQRAGRFADEIVPVTVTTRKGGETVIDTDEHPRPDSTLEKLSSLRAVLGRQDPAATVTAGNATARALDRAGLKLSDIDLVELNEAFAAQVLACTREWGFTEADFERFNVNGSGISLGHPVGATGGRILATLLREMARREVRYGLETMCLGGGQGLAAVFERMG